ncbi:hypothetical protein KY362_06000 [Candidatus Woesearchaeota archaeon]|nr:hypothetical protein [Candidatus Woesearchaeota archaeon]
MGFKEDVEDFRRCEGELTKVATKWILKRDYWTRADHPKLSDYEFAENYFDIIGVTARNNGWWQEGNVPSCAECEEGIGSLAQLRMYESHPYHPKCFRKVFEREGIEYDEVMTGYWQRVMEIEQK